jgi:hypothetical protein
MEHDPNRLAALIHEHARPMMVDDHWCINAAAITRDVLRVLDVPGFAVHADAIHMNAAYAAALAESDPTFSLPGYNPEPPEGQVPYLGAARCDGDFEDFNVQGPEPVGKPFNGHVLIYVPGWRAYIDPSADQFARPQHAIEIEPCAWTDAENLPLDGSAWVRSDGGVSIIQPRRGRSFVNSTAWQRRGDPFQANVVRAIVRDLRE